MFYSLSLHLTLWLLVLVGLWLLLCLLPISYCSFHIIKIIQLVVLLVKIL